MDGLMKKNRDILLIGCVSIAIFFVNLGSAKLWDRDEPRNAGCAREMMERGDLITPMFNDELRDAKPVLLYWFMMTAYQLFGINEFSARFWSAALGVGTVLCTYFIARRMFDRHIAVLAAIILSTSMMFGVASRAATPDSLLIFFSAAALAVFVAFAFPHRSRESQNESFDVTTAFPRSWRMAVPMYGLMGFGVLAKGPIGFLMPTAIIGMYLLVVTLENERDSQDSSSRHWGVRLKEFLIACIRPFHPIHFAKTCGRMRLLTAVLIVALVAGPWYYLVGVQTDGDFLKTFFLKEHLGRSTTSFENHSGSIFYYPMVMAIGFFPWSVFALPVFISVIRSKTFSRQLIFLFCWIGVQVGLFSLVQTKLPSYVTPCYPALAIVCGYYLMNWARAEIVIPSWLPRVSFATLGIAGVTTVIGLTYASIVFLNTGFAIGLIGLIPLIAGLVGLVCWNSFATPQTRLISLHFLAGSACLLALLFFGFVLPQVSQQQRYSQLLEKTNEASQYATGGADVRPLGSYSCLEPSWVFYGNRPIFELAEYGPDLVPLTARKKDWKPKPRPGLKQFLVVEGGQVITREELVPAIEKVIGLPVSIHARSPYFMKKGNLVLIDVPAQSAKQTIASRSMRSNEKNSR